MRKLLQTLLDGGEITISPWRVSAKGGLAISVVFILMLILLLR